MINTPLTQAPATPGRILHDTRAVLDACDLDLSQIGANPAEVWVVLRTAPAEHSGSTTIPGAMIDGDTGRLVDASGAEASLERPAVVVYEGSYEVLTVISGHPPAMAGRYSWREPLQPVARGLSREHVYDPFARPGTVVCRHDQAEHDIAPFDQVHLLPEGWERHIAEAVPAPREPSEETLRGWLTSPNPLLFTRAVTLLARGKRLDEPLLRSLLDRTNGYRRAVLHFVTLRDPEHLGAEAVRAGLDADFAAGSEPDHRRAAALGLLTARLFAPEATADAVAGWAPLSRPAGLLDAAVVAEDPYVREAFTLLTPA
jgi:hypothetical protein